MSAEELTIRTVVSESIDALDSLYAIDGMAAITLVRSRLSAMGWSREKQDVEFGKLAAKASFIPQSNQKALTRQQREDFFMQGGQPKSWVKFHEGLGS